MDLDEPQSSTTRAPSRRIHGISRSMVSDAIQEVRRPVSGPPVLHKFTDEQTMELDLDDTVKPTQTSIVSSPDSIRPLSRSSSVIKVKNTDSEQIDSAAFIKLVDQVTGKLIPSVSEMLYSQKSSKSGESGGVSVGAPHVINYFNSIARYASALSELDWFKCMNDINQVIWKYYEKSTDIQTSAAVHISTPPRVTITSIQAISSSPLAVPGFEQLSFEDYVDPTNTTKSDSTVNQTLDTPNVTLSLALNSPPKVTRICSTASSSTNTIDSIKYSNVSSTTTSKVITTSTPVCGSADSDVFGNKVSLIRLTLNEGIARGLDTNINPLPISHNTANNMGYETTPGMPVYIYWEVDKQ